MHKKLVMMAVAVLVAASAFAQTTVRCESTDGRYRECSIDGIGRIVMSQQLSDKTCIEGKTWGYHDNKVWVNNGCRADFALVDRSFQSRMGGKVVTCESQNGDRQVCTTRTRGGVAIAQQLSQSSCIQGRSWGYDDNSIWVDQGCRAQFVIGSGRRDPGMRSARLDRLVTCESIDGKPARCSADTSGGVQVVRQISDSSCGFGREWGYDADGIWVSGGCRAEFAVRSDRRAARVITSSPIAPQTAYVPNLVCSSENNTRSHCDTDTRTGITLVRQLSENPCIRDRTWGVDRNGVWVDSGCRGEFTYGHNAPAVSMISASPGPVTLNCESQDGKRTHCATDTSFGVRLLHQMSDSDCVLNSTWGFDAQGVWVDRGCRATFALGEGYGIENRNAPQADHLLCESKDGKRTVCPADTRLGVAVVRQLSDSKCILNSTWGYNTDGVWVTAGCRAEFVLRK